MSRKVYYKPKYTSGRCRLRSTNFANYFDYYHKQDGSADSLYLSIKKIVIDHKSICGEDELESFKNPSSDSGFYFKCDKCICTKNGKPCIIEDLFDLDSYVKLKIQPYDFRSEGKRIIGISIQLMEATSVKNQL
jgi:hypothetical protein